MFFCAPVLVLVECLPNDREDSPLEPRLGASIMVDSARAGQAVCSPTLRSKVKRRALGHFRNDPKLSH